jgi:hypothetical protein
MRKLVLASAFWMVLGTLHAQIGDCSVKSSYVEIYDSEGKYKTRFSISSSAELSGFSSTFIVVTSGSYAEIYDHEGKYKTRFSLPSNGYVKGVVGNSILVKSGSYIETYDKEGKYVSRRME